MASHRTFVVMVAVALLATSAFSVEVKTAPNTTATGVPDLIVSDLRIDADGKFSFDIRDASPAPVTSPFKVDAWLDGYLRQSVQVGGLKSVPLAGIRTLPTTLPFASNERRHFVLDQVKVDLCSPPHSLKVIVDAAGVVTESSKANDQLTWTGPTPCPDLTVESISKHWQNSMHTEFTAKVVIINKGTGNAGPFGVAAGGSSTTNLPTGAPTMFTGLKVGETITMYAGNAYVPDGISVHVVVDIANAVKELDETNNIADRSVH